MRSCPRTAWITGASTGLGRAMAIRMASEGWQIAASARGQAKLQDLALTSGDLPGKIHIFPLDVTDQAAVTSTWRAIEGQLGTVSQVVLNAGSHRPVQVESLSSEDFVALINLNLLGTVHCLEAALPSMLQRGAGRIAVVASLAGYRGLPTAAAYGMTKAGLINMAESLHPELKQKGIVMQIVNPGFVETPLTAKNDFAMPFLMTSEAAAEAFYRGLQSDRFEITFPWSFAAMMKLYRCMPAGLALALAQKILPKP